MVIYILLRTLLHKDCLLRVNKPSFRLIDDAIAKMWQFEAHIVKLFNLYAKTLLCITQLWQYIALICIKG